MAKNPDKEPQQPPVPGADQKNQAGATTEQLRSKVGTGARDEALEADIANRFTYHAPKEGQPEVYTAIRDFARQYAIMIARYTPKSREQSLALTHLEETVFWANASIARAKS